MEADSERHLNEQVGADSEGVNQKEIRISCLNVEHSVAKISEPDFVSYVKSFDIFCALETFTANQFDFGTHFQDYHVFHRSAIKLSTHGRRSGGVLVLVSKRLMPFVTQIDCKYDNMICIQISKDCVGLDKDLLFVSLYVPPYQSPYYKQSDTNCCIHHLEEFLLNLYQNGENAYLLVGGDFNAPIEEWDIVIDDEPDLLEDAVSGDSLRKSKDKSTNQFGKTLTGFCSTFHCMPLNGKHSGDLQGQFTFISQQGNSVVDYFVVSADFVSKTDIYL